MTAAPLLNAYYPFWLGDVAELSSYVDDTRSQAWLARRLPAEGVPMGDRMALLPWPFPEEFGTLGMVPYASNGGDRVRELYGYAYDGGYDIDLSWLNRLDKAVERSTLMLRKASRADESIVDETLAAPADLPLVRDWLRALPEVDPRMLDKLPRVTWQQGVEHAKRYHQQLASRAIRIASEAGTADPVSSVQDHRWLHLVTRPALDRESAAMGHCVGDGGYDYLAWLPDPAGNPVRPPDAMDAALGIWSLRDGDGRSVLTAEIGVGCIEQVQRRFNDAPLPEDVPHLAVLIAHLSAVMPNLGMPSWLLTDARDGTLYHVRAMPDGIHLDDGIYLDTSDWTRIPADLRVNGGTIIAGDSEETVLFRDLHVNGRLAVHGNVAFDAGLVVEGDFDLTNAEDKSVPEGARVTGRIITEGAEDPGFEGYHLVPLTAALNAAPHHPIA